MSYAKLGLAALTGVAAAYGFTGGRARGRRVEVGTDTLNPVQDAVFKAVKRAAPPATKWRVVRGKQHPITGYEDWDGKMVPVRGRSRREPSSTRGLQLITDDWRNACEDAGINYSTYRSIKRNLPAKDLIRVEGLHVLLCDT